jgi:hypothetical protein
MLSPGFVGVPVLFLESYANLTPQYGLDPAEVVLIISLMAHKWDERAPFPGYTKIAKWMGKSGATHARSRGTSESKACVFVASESGTPTSSI